MTSRPLFASVAESIVILAPIVQVGWRERLLRRDRAELVGGRSRNGPPDAVRISRSTRSPGPRPRGTARSPSAPSRSGRSQPSALASGIAGIRRGRARGGQGSRARHHEVAAGDERLLVGRRDDLAGLERGEDRPQADDATGPDDDHVDVVAGRELDERVRSLRPRLVPAAREVLVASAPGPSGSPRATAAGRNRRACSARSEAFGRPRAPRPGTMGRRRGPRGPAVRSSRSSRAARRREPGAAIAGCPAQRRTVTT